MRKKRRITKTAILKKWFLLLAITAGLVTSCKDYDDDIDGLNEDIAALQASLTTAQTNLTTLQGQIANAVTTSQVTTAVNTAKQQAIDAAAANVNTLLTTLKGGYSGTLKDLDDDIAAVAAQLAALEIPDISGLTAGLDAAEQEILDIKARLDLQEAALEAYKAEIELAHGETATQIEGILGDIAALQASTAGLAELQTAVAGFETQIDAIDGGLNVLKASVNSMITGISFVYDSWTNLLMFQTLNYATAVAQQNFTFGDPSWDSKVVFTKGSRLMAEEAVVYVKVTPTNADLSTMVDKIYLLSSNDDNGANLLVNNYIKAKKAERWTDVLFTRAGETGLWAITFELPSTANIADLADLTIDPVYGRPVNFAVGVENTVDDGETASTRGVVTEFGVSINVGDKEPVYNDQDDPTDLIFSVKNATEDTYTSYTDIRNRYALTESGITCKKDQRWAPGVWTTAEAKEDDDVDDRTGEAFFGAEVDKTFNVRIDNAGDVYAYYVVLDKDWAVESSPSEINAWNSYTYEGLNTVYRSGEIADLKITDSAANGDIIGFRVYVVNYDGTLVDPDGKSFYVYVGDLMATALAFEQRITAPVALGASVPSTVVNFAPGVNLASVTSATFSMTIGHGVVLGNANLQLLNSAGNILGTAATVTDWTSVAKLQIIGVLPSDLEENGKSYPGTLILKNTFGVSFSTTMVTLKKVMPTFDANISYKTNIHHDVNGVQVVYAYPLPGTRYYNLGNALNGLPTTPELGSGFVVVNKSAYSAGSLPTWETAFTRGTVPLAEIGVPYLPSATEPSGHGKIYDLDLTKDFGYVLYNQSSQCLIPWVPSPAIKAEFRSFVQDLVDWQFTGASQANYPALKYATNLTGYSVGQITALPPAGARINMTQNEAAAGNLQDLRSFTIIDNVKLLTGANYATVNEYFTPAFDAATETISFTAVITSPPAGPVPTKLQITLQDDFGHRYTFTIPKIFNMVLN